MAAVNHMRFHTTLFLSLAARLLSAQVVGPTDADRPILVLVKTDPWRAVIGSDSPAFVLYESGWVVQATDSIPFLAGKLNRDAVAALIADMNSPGFDALDSAYTEGPFTDAPTTILFARRPKGPKTVSVYAAGALGNPSSQVPAAFASLMEHIANTSLLNPEPWLPARTELLLEETPQTGDLLDWPQDWPAPTRYPGFFIAILSPAQITRLLSFLAPLRERPIWLRKDQRFSPLGLHFTFPGEERWMSVIHHRPTSCCCHLTSAWT